MPCGKIAEFTLGRLISGSNLISMNMHARDLHYVTGLARAYNTRERIFMTLKTCEESGANSIVLKDHNFQQFHLSDYWSDWGGNMLWHADVITTDITEFERCVARHLDLGASTVYLWGGASDIWFHEGKQENIVKAYEIMRAFGVPVGIGAHRLEPIAFCQREGLTPDYYIKTLHHDRYWSAHPGGKRRFMEMFEPNSPDHDEYHDNMFCHDHQDTIDFMQDVKIPWIAFKVLAAGAIPPEEGIQFAFDSGELTSSAWECSTIRSHKTRIWSASAWRDRRIVRDRGSKSLQTSAVCAGRVASRGVRIRVMCHDGGQQSAWGLAWRHASVAGSGKRGVSKLQ